MAISFPGDIISSAIQHAEPAKKAAATARLEALAAADTAGASFARTLSAVSDAPGRELAAAGAPSSPAKSEEPARGVMKKFEAVLLQQVFAQMMPEENDPLVQTGFAGQMWRSMQVEKMAESFAQKGGIGIAESMSRHYGGASRVGADSGDSERVATSIVDRQVFRMLRQSEDAS